MAIGLRSKKLLAIDWDKKSLRMAVVRPRGDGIDLLKAVSVPVPAEVVLDDAESFGAFLREAMKQSRVGAKQAVLSIPREQVVLNTLSLPPTPTGELAALVQFQIVKELPFSADQATIDFAMAPGHDPKEPCAALVAAIRDEELAFYRKVAHEAGLSIARIGLRPHANLRAVAACLPELVDQSALVVEVGPMLTEIDVVRSGALVFSRAASVPLPDLSVRDPDRIQDSRIVMAAPSVEPDEASREAVNSLMVDVIRSFEAYRATTPDVGVDQIVVCGATGLEAQLADSLAARFAARAQLFSPDRALALSPQRGKELRGFSAALGLALGQGAEPLETFDFLSPKKPVSKRSLRLKKAPAAGLAAAFLVAAWFAYDFRFVQPLEAEVAVLETTVGKYKKREKPLKAFKAQVEAIEDWKASDQHWPLYLAELTKLLPAEQNVYLTDLDFRTQTRRKSGKRLHDLTMKLSESRFGMVHNITDSLRGFGFAPVNVVSEIENSGGQDREAIYKADARIDAEIPDDLLAKAEKGSGGSSKGASPKPTARPKGTPKTPPADTAKKAAPKKSGESERTGVKAPDPKKPTRRTPGRRATPRRSSKPSPKKATKRPQRGPGSKRGGAKK